MSYYSADGQDSLLNAAVYQEFRDGTYVDVGAHDGVTASNTKFFNESMGWKGLCIEPRAELFEKLRENRPNDICEQIAISSYDSDSEPFLDCSGYTDKLSGLTKHYHPFTVQRIAHESKEHEATSETTTTAVCPLQSLLDKHNIDHIHLLSVSVNGAEVNVLGSVDFSRTKVDVVVIRNSFGLGDCAARYLTVCGFVDITGGPREIIIMLNSGSMFGEQFQKLVNEKMEEAKKQQAEKEAAEERAAIENGDDSIMNELIENAVIESAESSEDASEEPSKDAVDSAPSEETVVGPSMEDPKKTCDIA